jgi:hypothetical protein
MENGRIDGLPERLLSVARKPDDWFGPGRRIIGIARQIAPHDLTGLVGKLTPKGPVDPDKAVLNELPDLRVAERAHGFVFMDRHENPHIVEPKPIAREKQDRQTRQVQGNAHGRTAMGTFSFQPPRGSAVSGSGRRPTRY